MLNSNRAGDLDAVQNHTSKLIREACDADEPVLIEGPPNSGKTTAATELALHRDTPITYLTRRIDLYEQAKEWCENHDEIRSKIIPAPHRSCPTFQNKNEGSESAVKSLYAKGYSGRQIHLQFPNKTPCGKSCEYFDGLTEIERELDSIDFLIGNYAHANRKEYVEGRVVIIDEFDPEPFLSSFPNKNSSVVEDPGKIIPKFLDEVAEHDETFPSDIYQDVTDLIQKRDDPTQRSAGIDWFRKNKASRRRAQESEFLNPTAKQYDTVHAYAPCLTFSLLCMERIGPGIEAAPPMDGRLDEAWEDADLNVTTKCLRNRNTGTMYTLEPPDLTPAEQVIGLDGTPTIELWNLLYAPQTGFDHRQVISREDFVSYLESAMNMSLRQIGGGMHPYAGGTLSKHDEERFAQVQTIEDERFSLISTKKALEKYKQWGWFDRFVKYSEETVDSEDENPRLFENFNALNYGMVKSSNIFEEEKLGVVAGMPFPSNDLVRIWAGFCGQPVEISESNEDDGTKSFGELGDKIYQHLAHHEVVQAVLRFGRDESVYEHDGATVYISTEALPEWFEVDTELDVQSNEKESAVLAKLFNIYQSEEHNSLAFRTVSKLHEMIDENESFPDISKRGVRNALEKLSSRDHVILSEDRGANRADMYRWDGDGRVVKFGDDDYLLVTDDEVYAFEFSGDWQP